MPKNLQIKPRKGFKENIDRIVPAMLKEFRSRLPETPRSENVALHLHRSRLAGKPLRYLMETVAPLYGKEFNDALREVKQLLEILGKIHDCDVAMGILSEILIELPGSSKVSEEPPVDRAATVSLLESIVAIQETEKMRLTNLLYEMLARWDEERFVTWVSSTMKLNKVTAR
jgi:CHAD domain-containing protein